MILNTLFVLFKINMYRLSSYNYFIMNAEYILLLRIIQIMTIYNIITLGWKVEKIGKNKYVLSKKIESLGSEQFDLDKFLNNVASLAYVK